MAAGGRTAAGGRRPARRQATAAAAAVLARALAAAAPLSEGWATPAAAAALRAHRARAPARLAGRRGGRPRPAPGRPTGRTAAAAAEAADLVEWIDAAVKSPAFGLLAYAVGGAVLARLTAQVFELDQDLDEDLDLERARALSWAASRQRSRSATEELEADGGVEILEQADAFEVRRPQRPRSRAQVREPAAQTARRRPPRLTFLAELEGQFSQRDLVTSYGSLIETACRNGDTDVAEGWLREGAKIGFAPDAGTFEVFAKAAAVQGDLVACERWFDRTVEEGYAPGEAMYFSLVSAASRRGDLQSAERWFHRALEAGVRPGTLTLEALADAAGRKSAPSPKRKDIPRDVEIIEDADAFRRVRDSSGGQWQEQATPSWFADLQVQNTWSRATLISMYGILISNAGKNGNLIAAESWFRQGSSLGFQPTLKTFEALAEAAARSGSLSSAEEWIMEAIQAGFRPRSRTYTLVIRAAAKSGELDTVNKWVQLMSESGERPGIDVFEDIIAATGAQGDYAAAERWFCEAVSSGVVPQIKTFNKMIRAAGKTKGLRAAERWFEKALEAGAAPNLVTFNALIDAAAQEGNLAVAQNWAWRLFRTELGCNLATYEGVIGAAARFGSMAPAENWFSRAVRSGEQPELSTFNAVLRAVAKDGSVHDAEKWFRKALASSIEPDVETFNCMVQTAARCSDPLAAENWFKTMIKTGISPTHDSFAAIMTAAAKSGDMALTEFWFDECVRAGVRPREAHFQICMQAALEAQDPRSASRWAVRAREAGVLLGPAGGGAQAPAAAAPGVGPEPAAGEPAERAAPVVERVTLEDIYVLLLEVQRRGDVAAAERWFETALQLRLRPGAVAYGLVIGAACRARDCRSADAWFRRAQEAGFERVDSAPFEELARLAASDGDLEATDRWISRGRRSGLEPSLATYRSLVRAATARGAQGRPLALAECWFQEALLAESSAARRPVGSPAADGDQVGAELLPPAASERKLLESMGMKLIMAHLRALSREGLGAADRLLQSAADSNTLSVRMCSAVSLGHIRLGANFERVEEIFRTMAACGLRPDRAAFAVIIDACAERGSVEAASRWVDAKARSLGEAVDSKDYCALLRACAKASPPQPDIAVDIFAGMLADGIKPTEATLKYLRSAAGQERYQQLCSQEPSLAGGAWRWKPRGEHRDAIDGGSDRPPLSAAAAEERPREQSEGKARKLGQWAKEQIWALSQGAASQSTAS